MEGAAAEIGGVTELEVVGVVEEEVEVATEGGVLE